MIGSSNEISRETCVDAGGCSGSLSRRARHAGVRALIVALKPGNAGGAKGCRKVDGTLSGDKRTTLVPMRAKPVTGTRAQLTRLSPCNRTILMLTVPAIRDERLSPLPRLGRSPAYGPYVGLSVLARGKPPTGEPYAGEPHVRFGGRGGRVSGRPYPYCAAATTWLLARRKNRLANRVPNTIAYVPFSSPRDAAAK